MENNVDWIPKLFEVDKEVSMNVNVEWNTEALNKVLGGIDMPFEKKQSKDYYKEVWKFMNDVDNMTAEEYCECFGSGREVYDIYSDFESAKAVYDAYLKKKEEIKPGDYVKVKDCKDSIYAECDFLVIDIEKAWYDDIYTYRCIGRKRGINPVLNSKGNYFFSHLMPTQVEKTGKRCKNFDYAMFTLFEDC